MIPRSQTKRYEGKNKRKLSNSNPKEDNRNKKRKQGEKRVPLLNSGSVQEQANSRQIDGEDQNQIYQEGAGVFEKSGKKEMNEEPQDRDESELANKNQLLLSPSKYTISIEANKDLRKPSTRKSRITAIRLPQDRPPGTSGKPYGGHITPWVTITQEMKRAMADGQTVGGATVKVRKAITEFLKWPGHKRANFKNRDNLRKIYDDAMTELMKQWEINDKDIHEHNALTHLEHLVLAYLEARNAFPIAAVGTTNNSGEAEANVHERIMNYEVYGELENKVMAQKKDFSNRDYTIAHQWQLMDITAAEKWAGSESDSEMLAHSADGDGENNNNNNAGQVDDDTYIRRMADMIDYHCEAIYMAYSSAHGDKDENVLKSEQGLIWLGLYMKDHAGFRHKYLKMGKERDERDTRLWLEIVSEMGKRWGLKREKEDISQFGKRIEESVEEMEKKPDYKSDSQEEDEE